MSNNDLEPQYDGPRADLTIHKVDPREERWKPHTLFREQFRFRVMLKDSDGHWMRTEEAKRSFLKFLEESGGDEFEDWIQTGYAGEDGHPGHSIYCRSISFLLFARMLDNIELENHVHSIQERNDHEYPDDVKPIILNADEGTGPIMDLSEHAPTIHSAANAERKQKTSQPLTVFKPVPVILKRAFGPELPMGARVDVMLNVHGKLYLLKDGCFCDDAEEGRDFTFIGASGH